MPTRRRFLSAVTLTLPALAGCAGVLGEGPTRHYIDVMNGGDSPHTFAVTARDAEGTVLFERDYDLDAGEGDENRVVEGTPADLEVTVDGGTPVGIPWEPRSDSSFVTSNPDGCPDGTTTSLTLWYATETADELEPSFGCETVS